MIIGITAKEEVIIKDILRDYKDEYSFYYYGSRVKGGFEKVSDLDILIKGKQEMPISTLQRMKERFDESNLPYIVNFSDYNNMAEWFYNSIKPSLVLCEL